MGNVLLTLDIRFENDVVIARQRARQLTALLGFEPQDQVRLSTAVSEMVRNVFNYAAQGTIEFSIEGNTAPQLLIIKISDKGPGIPNVEDILNGNYRSTTGMGMGLLGAKRLVDQFEIKTARNAGTVVILKKMLNRRTAFIAAAAVAKIAAELIQRSPQDAFEEVRRQNHELMATLAELHARQQELVQLNRELQDTNRGVVALYAELDEKADSLRRADEMKSKFLSNMSHEFRTPLNSNMALLNLLLDRTDGPLTDEQVKQLQFVFKNNEALSILVNDLLDLAKIEAGKISVRPIDFQIADLFSALRGMLKPLLVNQSVTLEFQDCVDCACLYTDEGKVSQILKNFISNALKFTERGRILVTARNVPESESVEFSVMDTGIGIAPEDQPLIFKEFHQVDSALQRKVKGTGLGLPLSRKLAELLGGSASVKSTLGEGSTFTALIPIRYGQGEAAHEILEVPPPDLRRHAILVVEDREETRLVYEKFLRGTQFQFIGARSVYQAQQILETIRPKAIVLDIMLGNNDTWTFLAQLKGNNATRDIPVLVATSIDDQAKAFTLGANRFGIKPIDRYWLMDQLDTLIAHDSPARRALIVADRYSIRLQLRRALEELKFIVAETSGSEAYAQILEKKPQIVFVDSLLHGIAPEQVIAQIKADSIISAIPLFILAHDSTNIPGHFPAVAFKLCDEENTEAFSNRLKETLSAIW